MQEIRDRVLRHVGENRRPPLHRGQQRAGNRLREVLQVTPSHPLERNSTWLNSVPPPIRDRFAAHLFEVNS
jgi:hypothetical protein